MKQTVVEWLVEQLKSRSIDLNKWNSDLVNQAKEMEKEQIEQLKALLTGDLFKDGDIMQKIYELKKLHNNNLKKINMRFEDVKIGQHLWVISRNQLIMVAKFDDEGYQVCGDWEYGISYKDCEIIELVNVPKGYEAVKLFYL